MAGYISDDTRKVTTHRLVEMKQRGEKISIDVYKRQIWNSIDLSNN